MHNEIGSLIFRKLITTSVTTIIFSLLLASLNLIGREEITYNQGDQFIGWFLIFFMYIGVIILIYGNLVSVGIEYLQRKWFKRHDWLYVLILGFFGLANQIFFQELQMAIVGVLAALLYAVIDKLLYRRMTESKSLKLFFFIPITSLLIFWAYFHVISPPMPPFTKEDAIEFATSGEGTVIDDFPREVGQWEGTINGYQVTRESNAKEIGKEIYLVTFTERWLWSQNVGEGIYSISYTVERGSLSVHSEEGNLPPCYREN
ncbi:hypothetical protein [Paenisporosarcina sp. NPDC076898]|uniref:hypothetical protein n=1 Tax=unclassified Paenisporosarcina TaxID=2642018 RepID=UPI003D07DFAF